MKKVSWLKAKKVTGLFAAVALVAGFLFLDSGITGNVVLNGGNGFNILSLIGLLLILCSAILTVYTIRR